MVQGETSLPYLQEIPTVVAKMTVPAAYTTITEDSIKAALVEARGDIFVASQLLQVTALRVDRAIAVSPVLQETMAGVKEAGKGATEAQIHAAIAHRLAIYRVVGLDALHDLATMAIDANSAQNQVKLAAAARLAGTVEQGSGNEASDILRELNQSYQQNAPRLRVIREKTTIETIPAERTVGPAEPE